MPTNYLTPTNITRSTGNQKNPFRAGQAGFQYQSHFQKAIQEFTSYDL